MPAASALAPIPLTVGGGEVPLVEGPPTQTGRKRRVREWGSECECGERVADDLRVDKQGSVVRCKAKGCETEWVSVN